MGLNLFDQYTLLHFSTGVVAYFWNISLKNWFIIHTIFELLENTNKGVYIINNLKIDNIKIWPGGKKEPDALINIVGDTIGAMLGWLVAYYLDYLGKKNNWYNLHNN